MRNPIQWSACVLVALSAVAFAQPSAECMATETQAECHARLKCKADEELQDCQKRLRSAGGQKDRGGGDRGGGDRGGDDRGGDDRGGDDRGGDRGGDDRGSDDRGDYLFHPVVLASSEALELPFYVGVGLRYWDFDYCDNNDVCFGGSAIGVRVPLGLSFDFNNTPIDIFVQIVPTLDFLNGDYYDRYDDRTHFGFDGSVGLRYWFK